MADELEAKNDLAQSIYLMVAATAGQVVANALLSAGTGRIPLDRTHILRGGINARGRATGFHRRGTPVDEAHARVVPGTESAPDARGVYRAKVGIYDQARGRWVAKSPESTFPGGER